MSIIIRPYDNFGKNKYLKYKIAIIVLALVVVFQIVMLLRFWPRKPKKEVVPVKGRIAIVLDDWGYNLNNLYILKQISYPLTISILPNLSFSKRIAYEANNRGFEVILHLPLEPLPSEKMRLEHNTITADMDDKQIIDIFQDDLNSVPHARGISNHMGSKATGDPAVMRVIFKQMRKAKLYFLDSLVSEKSICADLSRKMKVGFAKRDIFLDNINDPEYIKGQIDKLKLKAKNNGFAIGIGHDRKHTMQILKDVLPELKKQGYQFVFVSDLIR